MRKRSLTISKVSSDGYTTANYVLLCLYRVCQPSLSHPAGDTNDMLAYEDVEQIYQKSKEAKPVPKEPSRPKSSGKPIKKEYPTFDINPLLARNFLLRLKTWKEDGAASEQRDFLQEKENHGAVSFQQSSEQYSPWKDVEVEEETPQTAEDRPATWAEALRRKQNLANGAGNNSQVQKGRQNPPFLYIF